MRSSLTIKIFLAIAATAALVIGTMALLVALSMRDGFSQYLLRGELIRFDKLVQELAQSHDPEAPGWPDLADDPHAWNDFVRAHFTPPGGTDQDNVNADTLMIGDRLALLDGSGRYIAGTTERTAVSQRRPICLDRHCYGSDGLGYIRLNAPLQAEVARDAFFLKGQYASLVYSALIALFVSAAAAYLIARQILTPIKRLEVGAKTLASGDYETRITQDRTDELGDLISHYNALARSLAQTTQAEREWISNTSHELQTPLAVLRAQIEALQDGVRKPDEATLAEMHAAQMRLSRLVQDLKILSYSRESNLATDMGSEDLVEIASEAAEAARPALEAAGIDIQCVFPETLLLGCDRLRIAQIIDNLLQNTRRYTDAPGKVRLRIWLSDGFAHLAIDDTPPTPPHETLPRIFDRFSRAEESRSRALGGSGLGLSVCKAIVEAHGGTITAATSDLGGLNITIALPEKRK
ncbi:ATP-binding protein [Octadecabacter sp. 1_MG-2023]|uniref:ATP-binding protein n=1 Tax=unclassified Octadecabacter TaxID=196158 RepID=UPI001C09AB0A|nr:MULTISPECIES: ATP-binding protein [unclassified Octadecabacter]MBU2992642.1 HAMP domain-containing protein [Octadecabacter sp. B2R22]MDO6733907.1 ATP-binding protein [Octadecabacter sp. 1_MG-2023]